jgi:hypothetical protein
MTTTIRQDALIDAAEERAKFYDDDDRECIKADVMNAFFAGAAYTQAAANKAAEEGELPALPGRDLYSEDGYEAVGYSENLTIEYARQAIAADRAARPVANKAEVDPVAWMRITDITEWADTEPETDGWTPLYATPPATTGASTARDQALEEAATVCDKKYEARAASGHPREASAARNCAAEIRALKSSVGASTVLTDERIDAMVHQAYLAGRLSSWSGFKKDDDGKYIVPALSKMHHDFAREAAAQAGQVAVPEGWKLVPTHPDQFMINAFIAEYERPGGSESGCYRAMLAAAPSPAKESK